MKGPLSGIKVLDLSRVLAGPYAAQILGDLGADVIKVENPQGGDDTRHWVPPQFEGTSSYYLTANRNKRSVALDFKKPEDLKKLVALATKADVLIENFKTGSLKKFGLDYDALTLKNPGLVYASITGFGLTGPLSKEPGYDVLLQAMGGLMSITGPNSHTPTKVGVAVADLFTGLYTVIAIQAALREREESGRGQLCDLSILDTQVSMLANIGMNYLCSQTLPQAIGNTHPSIVPYQSFETRDRPLMLAVGNDHQFQCLSQALGETWFELSRYKTNEARVENRSELVDLIQKKLLTKSRDEWLQILEHKGFPVGPINNIEEVSKNAQVVSRDLFTKMDDGKTPCIRSPIRLSRTPIKSYRRPPLLDENRGAEFH